MSTVPTRLSRFAASGAPALNRVADPALGRRAVAAVAERAEWLIPLVLYVVFLAAFLFLGNWEDQDVHDDLAAAFRSGQISVPLGAHWELIPNADGRAWSPFPPVPALPYIPFQLAGITVFSTQLGAFFGALGPPLLLLALRRLAIPLSTATWIAVGVSGATFGHLAGISNLWFYPQVLGAVLSIGALLVTLSGRWPLVAGLLLGLAAGSRLPIGFILPLLAYLYWPSRAAVVRLVAGVLVIAIPVALYNFARFGNPLEFGYGLIESFWHPGELVTAEPYFREGVLDVSYIPRSLAAMLLQGYEVRLDFPWIAYPASGVGVPLSAPILLLALLARRTTLVAIAWIAFVLVMLPNWAHGSWGFWQFGYRFIVDATVPLVLLIGLAYRERKPDWILRFAAVAGIALTLFAFAAEFWWNARTVSPAILP